MVNCVYGQVLLDKTLDLPLPILIRASSFLSQFLPLLSLPSLSIEMTSTPDQRENGAIR